MTSTATSLYLSYCAGLCFLLAHPVLAQSVRFERVLTPTNTVDPIAQDRHGFMWFGGEGLHRYDGYGFVSYFHIPGDSTSLNSNAVVALFVDRQDILWVGTGGEEGGLHQYDEASDTFVRYLHNPADTSSTSANNVLTMYEDEQGVLWIGQENGILSRFDTTHATFTQFNVPGYSNRFSNFRVTNIVEDAQQTLWIGMDGPQDGAGLYTFDRETGAFTRVDLLEEVEYEYVISLHNDQDGQFWVSLRNRGLVRFDPNTRNVERFLHNEQTNPSAPKFIVDVVPDNAGNLWITSTHSGLALLDIDKKTFTYHAPVNTTTTLVPSHEAETLYKDRQGTVWVSYLADGEDYPGLYKLHRTPDVFTHYTLNLRGIGPRENKGVFDFVEDREGTLWATALGGGLFSYDSLTNTFTRAFDDSIPEFDQFAYVSLVETGDNTLMVGGFSLNSLKTFDLRTNRYRLPDSTIKQVNNLLVNAGGIIDLYQDTTETIWIGTWQTGVIYIDGTTKAVNRLLHPPEDPERVFGYFTGGFFDDGRGNIWFGADPVNETDIRSGALYRFDMRTSSLERFPDVGMSTMFSDRAGRYWVHSTSMGLFQWDPLSGSPTRYTLTDGLPSNKISCVVVDDKGMLWISTIPGGLASLNPDTGIIRSYEVANKEHDFTVIQGMRSCFKRSDGTLFFGKREGVTSFHPDELAINQIPPDVALTSMSIDNNPVDFGPEAPVSTPIVVAKNITLRHDQNEFAIEYAGLHFEAPAKHTYRYILEGHNQQWIEAGSNRTARFSRVEPGDYTFRVLASNPDGIWNREGASISITVLPPWWQTIWAYLSYAAALIALGWAANRWQRQRLIQRERAQQQLTLAQLEKEAAAERAQMAEHLERVKSDFFVNLAHEFRTPLTLILGPLSDLLSGGHGQVQVQQAAQLQVMQRSGDRLLALINQLLDFEKLDAGGLHLQAQEDDVVAFAGALTLAFASRAERERKKLGFKSSMPKLLAYYDPEKLEKVLYNVISNAFKFTSDGDKIAVSVSTSDTNVLILVQDTGTGIPLEQQDLIFNRFHQSDSSVTRMHEGTGIGLALAKELVTLHKGSIHVESNPGRGSTFTVALPLGRAHLNDEEIREAQSIPHSPTLSSPIISDESLVVTPRSEDRVEASVLVVEDNPDLRNYLMSHLHAYNVIEAENGEEGLEKAIESLPDLIISDVMMPRMDGITLCQTLREDPRTQDIPFILLTAKAAEENKLEGLQAGADDYLYKPFSASELHVRMRNLIDQRIRLKERYKKTLVLKPNEVEITPDDAAFAERIRTVVEAQMGDTLFGVEQLAGEIGMSRRNLQRRMNRVLNMTATTFIREMRLERAWQLLESRAGNISEIAYAVGYNDTRHFSKRFKEKFGRPPSDWLKSAT